MGYRETGIMMVQHFSDSVFARSVGFAILRKACIICLADTVLRNTGQAVATAEHDKAVAADTKCEH